jgi:hypothetical protein
MLMSDIGMILAMAAHLVTTSGQRGGERGGRRVPRNSHRTSSKIT